MGGSCDAVRARPAEEGDSRDLWLWRNDEETRRASLSTSVVDWADHQSWFSRSLHDVARTIYIGEAGSREDPTVKVGMCRFDLAADGLDAEVSLNLDRRWRGKRMATPLLEAAIAAYSVRSPSVVTLSAVIRPANAASRATFLRAGFTLSGVDDGIEYYARPVALAASN